MPGIALFDFDGTITTNDNFVGFVKFYLVSGGETRFAARDVSRVGGASSEGSSVFNDLATRSFRASPFRTRPWRFRARDYLGPLSLLQGYLRLLPSILAYRCGFVSSTQNRTQINHVAFKGRSPNELSMRANICRFL